MNIKKSPLMAGLLTLNSIFGAMAGKAEVTPYTITDSDRNAIFTNQTELATVPVGNKGAMISVVKGWSAETDVTTNWVQTVGNGYQQVITSTLWTAPFIVYGNDKDSGFAKAYPNLPAIGAIAVNEDNGRVYAFAPGENKDFYQLSMGNITASEPLLILGQLQPTATTLGFHSENDETSQKRDVNVARAVAWTDAQEGEFILTYGTEGYFKTTIWHRNGVVNRRAQFAGIEPKEVMRGQDVIFYGDGVSMVSISKANPEAGETPVDLRSDKVGLGVIGDTLYQATEDGIYKGDEKLEITGQIIYEGSSYTLPLETINIKHMTMSYNGDQLVVACDADKDMKVKNYKLSDNTQIIAVEGATQVTARRDGIYAKIKNQMIRVHE